jgi:hypothetical protein
LPEPGDRLLVTLVCPGHYMIRDLQRVGTSRHEGDRGFAMKEPPRRQWYALINGILHELVTEGHSVSTPIKQLRVDGLPKPPDDLGTWQAGDGGNVPEWRHIAEHRCDL